MAIQNAHTQGTRRPPQPEQQRDNQEIPDAQEILTRRLYRRLLKRPLQPFRARNKPHSSKHQ